MRTNNEITFHKLLYQAILELRPDSNWALRGETYEGIEWHDDVATKPSKAEVEAKLIEVSNKWENTEYQRKRAIEYPALKEQLDMLWHAIDNGTLNKTSDFYTSIKAVKDTYPKSE